MANTYITRAMGTPTNAKKFTWSAWIKFANDMASAYPVSEQMHIQELQ